MFHINQQCSTFKVYGYLMEVYDFAIQKEKEMEKYYRDLALKAPNEEIKQVLHKLADEEVRHCEILEAMKEKADIEKYLHQGGYLVSEKEDPDYLGDTAAIFEHMKNTGQPINVETSVIDLYKKARINEEESYHFYQEKAGEMEMKSQKMIFIQLANMEKAHMQIMDSLIQNVTVS